MEQSRTLTDPIGSRYAIFDAEIQGCTLRCMKDQVIGEMERGMKEQKLGSNVGLWGVLEHDCTRDPVGMILLLHHPASPRLL